MVLDGGTLQIPCVHGLRSARTRRRRGVKDGNGISITEDEVRGKETNDPRGHAMVPSFTARTQLRGTYWPKAGPA